MRCKIPDSCRGSVGQARVPTGDAESSSMTISVRAFAAAKLCRAFTPPLFTQSTAGPPPSSSSNAASTAGPGHLLVDLQLLSVKLLIRQLRVERQPTTFSSSNRTPTGLFAIPLTYIRHPSSYNSANCAWESPSRAFVPQPWPQVQRIVTDPLTMP
jgi:hypothetical protein